MPGFNTWADDKRIKGLVILVLILAAVALSAYSYYTYKQSRYAFTGPNTISVAGKGEIMAKPDIGSFSFSVDAEGADAKAAQEKSATAMNAVVEYLKQNGVEDKDIKTSNYYLTPKYEWQTETKDVVCTQWGCPPQNGKQVQTGFMVNQTVEVKVRDTAKAGDLITGVGQKGATNISQLSFTIDDMEALQRQAREMAIKDARENAAKLADDLGVRLGRMMNYWEDQGGMPMPMMYAAKDSMASGAMMESAIAPSVPTGENSVVSNVTIVYEIR